MKNSDITDTLFREAVESIDVGDLPSLERLLNEHPQLVSKRLDFPKGGYFKDPYLLWFVACCSCHSTSGQQYFHTVCTRKSQQIAPQPEPTKDSRRIDKEW